jgi:hypothetical protein
MKLGKALSLSLRALALVAIATTVHAGETYVGVFFSPSSIPAGNTTTFLVQLQEISGVAFTDGAITVNYPSGLVNAASPIINEDCSTAHGASVSAIPGGNSLTVTNVALASFTSCFLSISVTASATGSYTITIPPGTFSATQPAPTTNSQTTTATLAVTGVEYVTNTADSGAGSLRAAINSVNSSCGSITAIKFNIGGAGPFVISPTTPLPAITCSGALIDGYSQPGSSPNTNASGGNNASIKVDINGAGCSGCMGLEVLASNVVVDGLAIRSFSGHGIRSNPGAGANTFIGNYIGTNAGGMASFGNGGAGIQVDSGIAYIGDGTASGRNLVTANASGGIVVVGGAATIVGNQIGGLRDASAGAGNGFRGVYFDGANYSRNTVTGNLILANGGAGIAVNSATFTRAVIQDNESFGNAGLGIDIKDDGASLNDEASSPYDTDGLQNYPVITSVVQTGTNTIVDGYLKSVANRTAVLGLYANASASATTEGEKRIASVSISLDATGLGTFTQIVAGTWNNVSAQMMMDTCGDGCERSSEYSPKVAALGPLVGLTPGSLTFASRTVSTTSPAQTVTLANTGSAPLAISSIAISGDFSYASSCGPSVAAGGTCTIDVTFTPLVAGARSGSLTVTDNAAGSPHIVPLSGTGVSGAAAAMSVTPSVVVFGVQQVGSASAPEIVMVSNTGTAPLTFSAINVTGEFSLGTPPGASPPACPVTLAPGASCRIALVFTPRGLNQRQGVLSIVSNGGSATLNVMGTGLVAEPPQLAMAASLDFGAQPVGVPSAGHPFEIRNTSPFLATISELTVSGDFAVSDTCLTIAAGAACSPLVTFQPTLLGPRIGTLTVRTLRDANPYTVNLSGVGEENRRPALEIAPLRVGFGNSFLGQLVAHDVVLRNSGLASLTISGIAVTGDFFSDGGCVGALAPGATCTVRVTFAAGLTGTRNGVMQVTSNAPGSPHNVDLSGTGCFIPSPSVARRGVLLCGP